MTESRIHRAAAEGFEAGAEAYERGRPAYSRDAVGRLARELGIRPGTRVLDLAAGTGKLTAALRSTGATFIAVEPVPAMRAAFARKLPDVELLDGTAEAIPLPDGAVDAVVVGQAFHWFDGERALAEIDRVLRPAGGVGLIWQARDPRRPWIVRLNELIDAADDGHPRYRTGDWRRAFDRSARFEPLATARYDVIQAGPPEVIVDRVASISYVAAAPAAAREALLREVRELLASDPDTRGREVIELPYVTDVYWTRARRGSRSSSREA